MNILAGEALRLRWDADAKDFVPAAATDKGAIFTIQSLDYFTAQAVLGQEDDDAKVKACIEAGLTAVEGASCTLDQWRDSPRANMVTPLFNAIWQHTWGN